MFTIENVIPKALFELANAKVHLHESPSTAGLPEASPVSIVQTDQTVFAHFLWDQKGWLANLLSPGCSYECRIYIEQMGAGEAANPAPAIVNFVPGIGKSYSAVIPVAGLPEGAYKLVATLLFRGPAGSPSPIASYDEIGYLQVYKDM